MSPWQNDPKPNARSPNVALTSLVVKQRRCDRERLGEGISVRVKITDGRFCFVEEPGAGGKL